MSQVIQSSRPNRLEFSFGPDNKKLWSVVVWRPLDYGCSELKSRRHDIRPKNDEPVNRIFWTQ